MIRAIFVLACIAGASAIAVGQPAEAPHHIEVITTDGARHEENPDRRELTLLASELATSRLRQARARLRLVCRNGCPDDLPARRPPQDVIHWSDGRRTSGTVFIHFDVVDQRGARAGRFEDVRFIEIGTAPVDARLARELEPMVVGAYWHDPWDGGSHAVFRQPWVTLSQDAITFNGRSPEARGDNLRFLEFDTSNHRPERRGEWTGADTVVWRDGSRTIGPVTVSDGLVRQAGGRPRSLREVAYIELARRPRR